MFSSSKNETFAKLNHITPIQIISAQILRMEGTRSLTALRKLFYAACRGFPISVLRGGVMQLFSRPK
jgi:hypothetical protein